MSPIENTSSPMGRTPQCRADIAALVGSEHAAALIELVQPGEWFRIYLHDQWTRARLTWRSDNGRYFMFSSRLAGRSHSLSRSTLERMIARGLLEHLTRGPAAARGVAGAA
jgi:hypothetical protein